MVKFKKIEKINEKSGKFRQNRENSGKIWKILKKSEASRKIQNIQEKTGKLRKNLEKSKKIRKILVNSEKFGTIQNKSGKNHF